MVVRVGQRVPTTAGRTSRRLAVSALASAADSAFRASSVSTFVVAYTDLDLRAAIDANRSAGGASGASCGWSCRIVWMCQYPNNGAGCPGVLILAQWSPKAYCVDIRTPREAEMTRTFTVRTGKDLGGAVREARLASGMTQEQLAEQTGLERSYLARMEAGLSVVLLDRAMRALRLLGAEVVVTFPERRDGP